MPDRGDARDDFDGEASFFVGSFFRGVLARSCNSFSDIESAICLEAPFNWDFDVSPRFADRAAPAAICCFFDRAGMGCLPWHE